MKQPLELLSEFAMVNRLTKPFLRSPLQVNGLHEADAELVRLPDGSFLAATVDTLLEEYSMGLIRDPFTVGWSVAAHSLSDLAAVAADPIGVLLSVTLPRDQAPEWSETFFTGVQAALARHGTHCLGGDTSFGAQPSFSCTALGHIKGGQGIAPLTRVGAKAGDVIYITGPLGTGNLLAIAKQVAPDMWASLDKSYRPLARLVEGRSLRDYVRCAIDTSDALIQALAILSDLNDVGVEFEHRESLYDERLVRLASQIRFPLWLVNVFGLGDYELVLPVDPAREADFVAHAQDKKISVTRIGRMTSNPGMRLISDGIMHELDVPYLLNLFATCESIPKYLEALVAYDNRLHNSALK
ncbi:MAG: thiamine-monophosphate kinase [Candidatus Riflebacteria bacterium]|nr:thiamine-monophosphate kinase [Candidatus Riflebacteria bacterium]